MTRLVMVEVHGACGWWMTAARRRVLQRYPDAQVLTTRHAGRLCPHGGPWIEVTFELPAQER